VFRFRPNKCAIVRKRRVQKRSVAKHPSSNPRSPLNRTKLRDVGRVARVAIAAITKDTRASTPRGDRQRPSTNVDWHHRLILSLPDLSSAARHNAIDSAVARPR